MEQTTKRIHGTPLTKEEREAVLAVLRRVHRTGVASTRVVQPDGTGLSRPRRLFNKIARKLGAHCDPFRDPKDFNYFDILPVSRVANAQAIESAMRRLSPQPRCRLCGDTARLVSDPSGFYEDAIDWDGSPLMCLNHQD